MIVMVLMLLFYPPETAAMIIYMTFLCPKGFIYRLSTLPLCGVLRLSIGTPQKYAGLKCFVGKPESRFEVYLRMLFMRAALCRRSIAQDGKVVVTTVVRSTCSSGHNDHAIGITDVLSAARLAHYGPTRTQSHTRRWRGR